MQGKTKSVGMKETERQKSSHLQTAVIHDLEGKLKPRRKHAEGIWNFSIKHYIVKMVELAKCQFFDYGNMLFNPDQLLNWTLGSKPAAIGPTLLGKEDHCISLFSILLTFAFNTLESCGRKTCKAIRQRKQRLRKEKKKTRERERECKKTFGYLYAVGCLSALCLIKQDQGLHFWVCTLGVEL